MLEEELREIRPEKVEKRGINYKGDTGHPEIKIDRQCEKCVLTTGEAVGGTGPDKLENIKLVVVSDYPGIYETQYGWNQVPNTYDLVKRDKKINSRVWRNSGQFIREIIEDIYNICPWENVYYTNALKCDPFYKRRKVNVSVKSHIVPCYISWLKNEISIIDKYNDSCPIIIGGKWALQAMEKQDESLVRQIARNNVYKEKKDVLTINMCRRRKDLKIGNHPIAVTYNPAFICKNDFRVETNISFNKKTRKLEVQKVKHLRPIFLGSPVWNFIQDIQWLSEYIS